MTRSRRLRALLAEKQSPSLQRQRCRITLSQSLRWQLRNVRQTPTVPLGAPHADVFEDTQKPTGAQQGTEESGSSEGSKPTTPDGRMRLRTLQRRAIPRAMVFVGSSLDIEPGLAAPGL